MRHFFLSARAQEIVIQSPADIIMAAQIVEEYIFLRKSGNNIKLSLKETYISRSHSMPGCRHRRYVIKHMTFRLFHSAKIRNYFLRLHDHFAKQKNRRTYNLSDNPHHSDDGVNPAQVPAWGSQFFPDIRLTSIPLLARKRKLYIISLNTRGFR